MHEDWQVETYTFNSILERNKFMGILMRYIVFRYGTNLDKLQENRKKFSNLKELFDKKVKM